MKICFFVFGFFFIITGSIAIFIGNDIFEAVVVNLLGWLFLGVASILKKLETLGG